MWSCVNSHDLVVPFNTQDNGTKVWQLELPYNLYYRRKYHRITQWPTRFYDYQLACKKGMKEKERKKKGNWIIDMSHKGMLSCHVWRISCFLLVLLQHKVIVNIMISTRIYLYHGWYNHKVYIQCFHFVCLCFSLYWSLNLAT